MSIGWVTIFQTDNIISRYFKVNCILSLTYKQKSVFVCSRVIFYTGLTIIVRLMLFFILIMLNVLYQINVCVFLCHSRIKLAYCLFFKTTALIMDNKLKKKQPTLIRFHLPFVMWIIYLSLYLTELFYHFRYQTN